MAQLSADSEESAKPLPLLCHSRSPELLQVHNREDEGMTQNRFDQQQQKKGLEKKHAMFSQMQTTAKKTKRIMAERAYIFLGTYTNVLGLP